jgi:hypothetical protein
MDLICYNKSPPQPDDLAVFCLANILARTAGSIAAGADLSGSHPLRCVATGDTDGSVGPGTGLDMLPTGGRAAADGAISPEHATMQHASKHHIFTQRH